ncbi:MAG: hypothetical protein GTO03_02380 [Planctomycetales bacterium]|nr:hypothetical protein [Planctomycetales bacterium]
MKASQVKSSQTRTMTSTMIPGITKSWIRKPAEGGRTVGNDSLGEIVAGASDGSGRVGWDIRASG